jgi:integrase
MTRREAEEMLGTIHPQIHLHGTLPTTRKMALDLATFLDRHYVQYVKGRWVNYKPEAARIEQIPIAFGPKRLDDITPAEVDAFITKVVEDDKPATSNRYLEIRWGFASKNPAGESEGQVEPKTGSRHLTPEDFCRITAYLNPIHRPLAITMAYTGMRLGEAIGLTWADVDYGRGLVRVTAARAKPRRELFVHLSKPVADVLRTSGRGALKLRSSSPALTNNPSQSRRSPAPGRSSSAGLPRRCMQDIE